MSTVTHKLVIDRFSCIYCHGTDASLISFFFHRFHTRCLLTLDVSDHTLLSEETDVQVKISASTVRIVRALCGETVLICETNLIFRLLARAERRWISRDEGVFMSRSYYRLTETRLTRVLSYFVATHNSTARRVSRTTHLEAMLPFRVES